MPILHAAGKRILYIHVPKAAGTTIGGLLGSYGEVTALLRGRRLTGSSISPQHLHAEPLRELFGYGSDRDTSLFDYVFTIVRDPIARFESEYAWVRSTVGGRRTLLSHGLGANTGLPINLWAPKMLARQRRDEFVLDNHLRPQHEFVCLGAEVFRLEDGLGAVRKRLDTIIGTPGEFTENQHVSPVVRPSSWRLSGSALSKVAAHYRADFDTFGYQRPTP